MEKSGPIASEKEMGSSGCTEKCPHPIYYLYQYVRQIITIICVPYVQNDSLDLNLNLTVIDKISIFSRNYPKFHMIIHRNRNL